MTLPTNRPPIKVPMYVVTIVNTDDSFKFTGYVNKHELEEKAALYGYELRKDEEGNYKDQLIRHHYNNKIADNTSFLMLTVTWVLDPNPPADA